MPDDSLDSPEQIIPTLSGTVPNSIYYLVTNTQTNEATTITSAASPFPLDGSVFSNTVGTYDILPVLQLANDMMYLGSTLTLTVSFTLTRD
jgi:hypothetical protein